MICAARQIQEEVVLINYNETSKISSNLFVALQFLEKHLFAL